MSCIHEHEHCWHESNIQHQVPNHLDVFCCKCQEARCATNTAAADQDCGTGCPRAWYTPYTRWKFVTPPTASPHP